MARPTDLERLFKSVRTDRGLSQTGAAAKVPTSLRSWIEWERGRVIPSLANVILFSAAFEQDLEHVKRMADTARANRGRRKRRNGEGPPA